LPKLSETLKVLKLTLVRKNPVALATDYGDMHLSLGQLRLLNAICSRDPKYSQIIVKTPRGGGKTKIAAMAFAWLLLTDRTWRIFVHSGSFEQARYLYGYFKPLVTNPELFPPDWLEHEPTRRATEFKEGGYLRILAASERQSRGGHVDIIALDEAVLISQDLIDAVWPTVRTSKRPKRLVMSTASPKVSLDWFLHIWQDAGKLGFERFEWSLSECPWINEADTKHAALLYGIDSETYKIEYLGEIAERRGRVWDGLLIDGRADNRPCAVVDPNRRELYPLPSTPPLTEWSCGLDFGYIHPTVLTVWEKQGETVYCRECRIWSKLGFSEIWQEIKTDFPDVTIYADSNSPGEIQDLRNLGLRVFPVVFSKEKAELINHVRWRLEQGFIKIPDPDIDRAFFTLVQQMKAYHYDPSGKPAKVNDDCVDSMLCAMKSFVNRPIIELTGARRRL
jgi:hypothetical protein